MRLFLDANVLFTAAIFPNGASRSLFEIAGTGACTLLGSRFAIDEARRNIRIKYPSRHEALIYLVEQLESVREPSPELVVWAAKSLSAKNCR